MFEVDLGKIKFKWMGQYINTVPYEKDDVVSYSGSSYIAKNPVTGVTPTSAANPFWDIMALGSDLGSVAANAGDFFYYDGSSFQNLGAGALGQVLLQGGNNTPQWQTPDVVAPVIQQRQYTDYNRTGVANASRYYFGQSASGCSITPRKYNSIIKIDIHTFGEPSTHNNGYRVQFSTDNGANWANLRITTGNASRHGQSNAYESDYASTPGHSSVMLMQAFSTLNPVCFCLYMVGGGTMVFNGSYNAAYEHAQTSICLSELNADYNSITYNGGS